MNKALLSAISMVLLAAETSCGARPQPSAGEGWSSLTRMPTPRSENAAAAIGEVIYVAGGFGGEDRLEAYDTATDTWQTLAGMPEGRHHLMSAAYDGKVYAFGGGSSLVDWRPRPDAWVYDPANDSWAAIAPMPEPRLAGAAVTMGDYIYIAGGTGGSKALLRYDPEQDAWTSLAEMSEPREHTTATALGGKVYVLGGRWSGEGELNSVEVYDPASDSWSFAPAIQTARAGFAAVAFER